RDKADEKRMMAAAKAYIDGATNVEVTLDTKPITGLEGFRVASGLIDVTGPDKREDAVLPQAVGEQKVATEGYWILLKPLPAGKHTLQLKGRLKGVPPFALDVTYELSVEEKK